MKKIYKFISTVLCLALLCTYLIACKQDTTTANADEYSYVSMRINPEIELVVDSEGKVVAVNAINEDGETVLTQLNLIGMTAEEAGEAFTSVATELGFIDVNTEEATVYILAEGKNDDFVKGLEEKLTKRINGFFDKKGIFGKVSPEELEEFEALATEWNVSVKDARMIDRILQLYPEMTVEEILALDFEERIKLIKDDMVKNNLPAHLREEYKEAVDAIKEEYAELFELAKELKKIEKELKNIDLTEEALTLIQEQYNTVKAEFEALKEQFDAAIEELKVEKREKAKDVKKEIEDQAQKRRDEFAGKLQEHEQKFQEQKEEIEKRIHEWRNTHR